MIRLDRKGSIPCHIRIGEDLAVPVELPSMVHSSAIKG